MFLQSSVAFNGREDEIFDLFDLKICFIEQSVVKFPLNTD
jgi:hypothetical protein